MGSATSRVCGRGKSRGNRTHPPGILILRALRASHPYEEVAYYLSSLKNENQEVGAGMIGELETPLEPIEFLERLKKSMALNIIRHTRLPSGKIKRVAVCGGSGSFLLSKAIQAGADAFVTADFKYHEFLMLKTRFWWPTLAIMRARFLPKISSRRF